MHYYQFNIGDYAKATRHLNNTEDLAYRRMIELYYDTERPLINDVVKLSRLINMKDNQEEVKVVLDDFFIESEEGFRQGRIDNEISIYQSMVESARVNGRKGGRPRKAKANPDLTEKEPKITQPVNLVNPDLTEKEPKTNPEKRVSEANQEPVTNNQEPVTNNQDKEKASAKANEPFLIFSYWKEIMKKNDSAKFGAKRLKAVQNRLKEGYTVDEIKQAIKGCSVTPHNMGKNDNGKVYDCLELICRDGTNIERFAGNAQQAAPQQYSTVTERNINNIMGLELD